MLMGGIWDRYQAAGEQKATQARGIRTASGQRGFITTFPAVGKGQIFALNHGGIVGNELVASQRVKQLTWLIPESLTHGNTARGGRNLLGKDADM